MRASLFIFFFAGLSFLFISCEDPELDTLMSDYCECISESRYDEELHLECVEMMTEIRKKYEGKPRKLAKVLEKTDECY